MSGGAGNATPVQPSAEPPLWGALLVLGVVLLIAASALSAIIEVLLVPLYVGGVIFPISVVIAVAGNIALPRLLRGLTGSIGIAAIGVVVWLLVFFVLAFWPSPEGDVLLPGYGDGQYVSYALMLAGPLVGILALTLDTGERGRVAKAAVTTSAAATGRR
ncbi:MAG TPA: hypothetical protein VK816_00230 [Jatrophihabitantaceae bacterium]|nr:hypothetical protein [Jatrophihabitantaceae bacterium]